MQVMIDTEDVKQRTKHANKCAVFLNVKPARRIRANTIRAKAHSVVFEQIVKSHVLSVID